MGLISFWTSLTAPRVREIASPSEDIWRERGRLSTAAALRGPKPDAGSNSNQRPSTANGEKKRARLVRSLSRPRLRHTASSYTIGQNRSAANGSKEPIPRVPSLPSLPILHHTVEAENESSEPADLGRPGTAISSEALNALQIFELPADPTPPEETAHPCDNPLIRRRSQSAAPNRPPLLTKKSSSWFRVGGTGRDKALPPPPPPTCPLPPVPGQDARPTTAKSSTEEGSTADTLPPVPSLVDDNDEISDSSFTTSENGSVYQPTSPGQDRATFTVPVKERRIPGPIQTGPIRGHRHQDSAIGTPKSPHTPTGIKRWTRQMDDADVAGLNVRILSEESAHEWQDDSPSSANEQALAALQFGALR